MAGAALGGENDVDGLKVWLLNCVCTFCSASVSRLGNALGAGCGRPNDEAKGLLDPVGVGLSESC